jgi:hypothetical protein
MALSDYGRGKPEQILRDYFPLDAKAAMILKSAVSPTKSSDFPPTDVIGAFRSLAPASAAWKLFDHPSALKLDLTGKHQINIPHLASQPPAPVFVAEAAPGPVLQWSFLKNVLGPVRKILCFVGISEELEAASPQNASAILGRVLSDAMNKSIDTICFDANPDNGVRPAGLLNGVTPLTAASGTDKWENTQLDLANLIGAIANANIDASDAVFIAHPGDAAMIQQRRSGNFDNEVLATLGLARGTIMCVAPAGIASGFQGPPEITASKEATLHWESATPADIVSSPGVVAAPVRTPFQEYMIITKVRAEASWCSSPGAVSLVSSVSW